MRGIIWMLFLGMLLLSSSPALHAQNIDYLGKAKEFLAQGDCERAEYAYQDYKKSNPQGNAEVERRLDMCKRGQTMPQDCGKMRDYDGNVYNTVQIGSQCWMAENMRTRYDRKGTKLKDIYPPNGDEKNVARYGYLYDWWTAKTICPKGWHLPNDKEWQQLIDGCSNIGDLAGGERGTWIESSGKTGCRPGYPGDYNYSKRNVTGFNALPAGSYSWGGDRDENDSWSYDAFHYDALFWSSTIDNGDFGTAVRVRFPHEQASNNCTPPILFDLPSTYMSVRCVRD